MVGIWLCVRVRRNVYVESWKLFLIHTRNSLGKEWCCLVYIPWEQTSLHLIALNYWSKGIQTPLLVQMEELLTANKCCLKLISIKPMPAYKKEVTDIDEWTNNQCMRWWLHEKPLIHHIRLEKLPHPAHTIQSTTELTTLTVLFKITLGITKDVDKPYLLYFYAFGFVSLGFC